VTAPRRGANWFIAFPVPDDEGWLDARVGPPPNRVRRFHPADLHATLAFLGPVEESAARRAFELARGLSSLPPPLRIGLSRVVGMGPPGRWSALSALLAAGRPELEDAIAAGREPILSAAGAPSDRRPPLPHVTVARLARRVGPGERRAAERWAETLDLSPVVTTVDALALYTWSEDRTDRLFRIVDRAPLPGGPGAGG
jgi:2'-5' RNA ligase